MKKRGKKLFPIQWVATPDGVGIAVYEWGDPAGPELLLIHGVGQSHLCFFRQYDGELARNHRIIAYDARGHGGSDKPLEAAYYHDRRRWTDEMRAVIAAKGLRRPVLVGWSMGGRIIGQYLIEHGDRGIGGINFVAARVVPDPAVSAPGMAHLPLARPHDVASRIEAAAAFLRACYHRQPRAADFATALAYNVMVPPEVRAAIRGAPADVPATMAALRAVRVPTLITHGRDDAVVLPAAAEATASLVPGAILSWYDDCGHSPFQEHAPRFNRELADFAVRVAGTP